MNYIDYTCEKCFNMLTNCKRCSNATVCLECNSGVVNPLTY